MTRNQRDRRHVMTDAAASCTIALGFFLAVILLAVDVSDEALAAGYTWAWILTKAAGVLILLLIGLACAALARRDKSEGED